jgi:hypothetical protein
VANLTGGSVYVPNPTPQVLRYGLFTVAVGPNELPPHAADSSTTWLSNSCGEASGYEILCLDSLAEKGPFTDGLSMPEATPFVVVAGFACAGLTEADRRAMAMEKLRATEQAAVEEIFSEGTFGQSPSLSNNTPAATSVGPAVGIPEAFSQLEEAFYATYHYPGVIHLPLAGGAYAQEANVMAKDRAVWRTALGTAVSIGKYSGLSPAGAAPVAGFTWVYITPPVAIWRAPDSDVFISPIEGAFNRETNEVTTFAEREYVVAYDNCPTFATQVALLEGS